MKVNEIEIGDNAYWIIIWSMPVLLIIILMFGITNYYDNKNEKIVKLIQDGHNPLSINCAFDDEYGNHPTCIVLATNVNRNSLDNTQ